MASRTSRCLNPVVVCRVRLVLRFCSVRNFCLPSSPCSLHSSISFRCQTCPFTPFKIKVSVRGALDKPYWVECFVDGIKAQRLLLKGANASATFVGFAEVMGHRGSERAFCFGMPRPSFEVNGRVVDTASDLREKDKVTRKLATSLRARACVGACV